MSLDSAAVSGLSFYFVVAGFLVSLTLTSGESRQEPSPMLGKNVKFASIRYSPKNHDEEMSDKDKGRRNKVNEMMKHAWDNFTRDVWGKVDDPSRVYYSFHLTTIELGTIIIGAMDTLYIMGMDKEFAEGKDWISKNFTLEGVNTPISVSETTSQLIGGLLSCFALTGETMFRDKAQHVADKLLPAFSTPSGLPYSYINPSTGSTVNNDWTKNKSILTEVGSLFPEFKYLSDLTGKPIYMDKVKQIRTTLKEAYKSDSLYTILIDPMTGKTERCNDTGDGTSLEAHADSFYEFLWRAWLINKENQIESRQIFDEAISPIIGKMIKVFQGITYNENYCDVKIESTAEIVQKMDQLACFSGGLFALASATLETRTQRYMDLAKILTDTCRESYYKIDPRIQVIEDEVNESTEIPYVLSSETIGSYFILWRSTKDKKYKDWGWEELQAIEKNCPKDDYYAVVRNVCSLNLAQYDAQRGYFLSETLKYLYLLFSGDKQISQEDWVFNTAGHPLPVEGKRFYRVEKKLN